MTTLANCKALQVLSKFMEKFLFLVTVDIAWEWKLHIGVPCVQQKRIVY